MTLTRIITNKHIRLTCISSPLFTSVFTLRRVLVGFPSLFHLLIFPATFLFIYLLYFLILSSPDPFVHFSLYLNIFLISYVHVYQFLILLLIFV